MIVYTGKISTGAKLWKVAREHGWREMATPPVNSAFVWPPAAPQYALDNGAFLSHRNDEPWDEGLFRECLAWAVENRMPDWVVAPDIVGGGWASWRKSEKWRPELQEMGFKVYCAVQDGMEQDYALGKFDGLFVGGTVPWKLRTGATWALFAHTGGMKCHIGRVGTYKRVLWAVQAGADSIDSNQMLWSKRHLRFFMEALEGRQGEIFT